MDEIAVLVSVNTQGKAPFFTVYMTTVSISNKSPLADWQLSTVRCGDTSSRDT